MTDELRFSEELPDGVRRIDPRQWRFLMGRLEAVRQTFPDPAIVGGTALRIWCSLRNMDIPEETAYPDIDILSPKTRLSQTKAGRLTGTVEIYPAFGHEFEEPQFTTIEHANQPLVLATPAHLMVRYAGLIYDHAGRGIDYSKHAAYYQIARDVVLPHEIPTYTEAVPSYYGYGITELLANADTVIL